MNTKPSIAFAGAIDAMATSGKSMPERVLEAYTDYIGRVEVAEVPPDLQYLFRTFKRCMEPRLHSKEFSSNEARQIAKVIVFIAEEIKKHG